MSEQTTTTTATAQEQEDEHDYAFPPWHLFGSFERRGNSYPADWRRFLTDVAIQEFEQTAFFRGMDAAASAIDLRLQDVEGPVGEAAGQLSDCHIDVWTEACEFGALLGYALARTAPDGLEGLDSWLARAKRLAAYGDHDPSTNHGFPMMPAEWAAEAATAPPIAGGSDDWLDRESAR